ncbi:unnamed protein product [Protopolystoma xenopodis]|uniref:Uncharacterized protein n=1 Tax=Protopolystoma xenopodis TaxID=117903 RepID=A0A448WF50_9PLAT|nr:unnamed protein product [Protopolystoma xenopodis]
MDSCSDDISQGGTDESLAQVDRDRRTVGQGIVHSTEIFLRFLVKPFHESLPPNCCAPFRKEWILALMMPVTVQTKA